MYCEKVEGKNLCKVKIYASLILFVKQSFVERDSWLSKRNPYLLSLLQGRGIE